MAQFLTLAWLKWRLFRNSLRSKKAQAAGAASITGTLAALILALGFAIALGFAAYGVTDDSLSVAVSGSEIPDPFSILFVILSGVYLMWATVPLSLGGTNRFDPAKLLLYPISLPRLFMADFASELASLGSIFGVPIVIAVAIGAGIGRHSLAYSLAGGIVAAFFGLALSRWLSISIGALTRNNRSRGESVLAVMGVVVGVGCAFAGQMAPAIMQNKTLWKTLRWSPPGVAVMALTGPARSYESSNYLLGMILLIAYTLFFLGLSYWIARRSALQIGGAGARTPPKIVEKSTIRPWAIPLLPGPIAAIYEKEMRYSLRNAQLRMIAFMPLVLIGLKFMAAARQGGGKKTSTALLAVQRKYPLYTDGIMSTLGLLYIFMIISMLAFNSFAYEGSGMKTWILSPIERRHILVGKNLMLVTLAATLSAIFLLVNQIAFGDLTLLGTAYTFLSWLLLIALFVNIGNWFSIHFPKRMQYGKRMNTSGVTGLLLLPMILAMGIVVTIPVLTGVLTRSLFLEYATLISMAVMAAAIYLIVLPVQGRALARRERDILEAVSGKDET